MSSSNKKIAKNTLLLYFRMFITMFVSLYASREILKVLGIEDFGIYNIVAGVIVLFSFVNGALVSSTQRFLNFEIGKGNIEAQKSIFNASLTIYIIFCFAVLILAETVGLWFVNNKLKIPTDRLVAANWVYQFSLIAFFLNIIRVPYNAVVIAHERMSFYAYLSILEVILKIVILIPLVFLESDKLIMYGIFISLVSLVILLFYQGYCLKNFSICTYKLSFHRQDYGPLLGFSTWSLFGSAANMVVAQGINILFNMVYGVNLNAALGLNNQVKNSVGGFLTNFQTAFSPQIVKAYAANDQARFLNLILYTSKYSFFLSSLVIVPFYFNVDFVISKWLGNSPEFLVPFIKWSLISLAIDALSAPLGIAVQATGKLRKYQLWYSLLSFSVLPIAILVTYLTKSPVDVYLVWVTMNCVMYIWKIFFVARLIKLSIWLYCKEVLIRVLAIVFCCTVLIYLFNEMTEFADWKQFFGSSSYIAIVLLGLIYFLGLKKSETQILLKKINSWVQNRKNVHL